jgi:hypothetical protein
MTHLPAPTTHLRPGPALRQRASPTPSAPRRHRGVYAPLPASAVSLAHLEPAKAIYIYRFCLLMPEYQDSTLSPGTTYYDRVVAVNSAGEVVIA